MNIILTAACPEEHRDDATNLAVCLGWIEGWSSDEWEHAFTSQRQDANGNLYRVLSLPVGESFIGRFAATSPVERPPQDVEPYIVNLTGARRAQALLVPWVYNPNETPPQAIPDRIVAIAGMPGVDALAAMGLQHVAEGEI